MKSNSKSRFFPAEWEPQSGVQLTWPHANTDWLAYLEEATECFVSIAKEIAIRQKVLIVCENKAEVKAAFEEENPANIILVEIPTNDTWARDHAAITVLENGVPILLDFKFNGWGLKFPANLDNGLTRQLYQQKCFETKVRYENQLNFVLEGGSLESDGAGTLLTTSACLLSANRNGHFSKKEIETFLKDALRAKRILWLEYGYLAGDDTDSHIDTLARFCNEQTIAYVQCTDPTDIHYAALSAMESELKNLVQMDGTPYQLVPLPMAAAVYHEGERLPATYANFLIINEAVLLPFYGTAQDEKAQQVLQNVFPNRKVIGIDCQVLIKQHGSLHCVTMQYPEGVIK